MLFVSLIVFLLFPTIHHVFSFFLELFSFRLSSSSHTLFLPYHLLPLPSPITSASTITGTNLGFHISISLTSHPDHSIPSNAQTNRNNPTQPLDCYKQVDSFKNIVGKLEKVSLESLFLYSSFSLFLLALTFPVPVVGNDTRMLIDSPHLILGMFTGIRRLAQLDVT